MTAPACGSCTAPVSDAYLCAGCTRDLAELLLTAASIAPDLDDAVARLLKRGSGGRRSEAEAPLPVDLAASEVRIALQNELLRWGRVVADHIHADALAAGRDLWRPAMPAMGMGDRLIAHLATWLTSQMRIIRQLGDAGDAKRDIAAAVHRALAVIDRKPDRAPAGMCDNCGRQLLAELGADSVTCGCGMTALALQDKRRERAQAADVLGSAAAISDALKAIGITVPRGTITSWASRGRLLPRPGGAYALSDVLALHAQSQARR